MDHFNRGQPRDLGRAKRGANPNIDPPNPNTNRALFDAIAQAVRPLIADAKGPDEWLLEWRMYPTTPHYERDVAEKGQGCGCGCGCGE